MHESQRVARTIVQDLDLDGTPRILWQTASGSTFPVIRVGTGAYFESLPGVPQWLTRDDVEAGLPIQLFMAEARAGGSRAMGIPPADPIYERGVVSRMMVPA